MAIKYIPFVPDTLNGQALLDNFVRTRRIQTLRYQGNDEPIRHISRGMPLYETRTIERMGKNKEGNLIVHGDCLSTCALLKDQGQTVDLVYIDPPFASGADYAKKVYLRPDPLTVRSAQKSGTEQIDNGNNAFDEKIYGDIWTKEHYLNWMYENLMAIKSVMSEKATIYVHLDWHIGHYVKVLMDEIFGENNFRNEIVWHYYNKMQGNVGRLASNHDVIFVYSKSDECVFHPIKEKRPQPVKQIKRVWDKETQRLVNAKDKDGKVIYIETDEITIDDVWRLPMLQPADKTEPLDYATQKPEALLERIIYASSDPDTVVADFFGGSGVTAAVASRLGRRFVHADIGLNSILTTRDRLRARQAQFDLIEVKDGISLYRNPIQTMERLEHIIPGFRNDDTLGGPWAGNIVDAERGTMPVYLPNLLDSASRTLDKPVMMEILHAIALLPSETKTVVVYYIDIDDETALRQFIQTEGDPTVGVELRDLKELLDEVIPQDYAEWRIGEDGFDLFKSWRITLTLFHSDRVCQAIQAFNQKAMVQHANGKGAEFHPVTVSEHGLDTIEWISVDCTCADADQPWHSDSEIKIDRSGHVVRDGMKTRELWDGSLVCPSQPLRMKIRNICGDETTFVL